MCDLTLLHGIELVPVVELEPSTFSASTRRSPTGSGREVPEEWNRYWQESLADSGVTGLRPLFPGSWHVPTTEFVDRFVLQRTLDRIIAGWGGIEALTDPEGDPVLNGGLALRIPHGEVLVEPACCVDLRNHTDWEQATRYRGSEWEMLWIGHPWMSVRFQEPWLILSEPGESDAPVARWAVDSEELSLTLSVAEAELARFAVPLARALAALGFQGEPGPIARKLAGLDSPDQT